MSLETKGRPVRLQKSSAPQGKGVPTGAAYVGPGSKWNNPFRKQDVVSLLSSQPDIAAAYQRGGWKAAAVLLYRDYMREEGLDPMELRGKDLICTCRVSDVCHADVLLELANG